MEKTTSSAEQIIVRPPVLKNLIYSIIFALIGTVFAILLSITASAETTTVGEKTVNCILFAVFLIVSVLAFSGMLDSIRNIFALPTFKLNNEEIFICKYGAAPLSKLKGTELVKKGTVLIFTFEDGSSAILRSRMSGIPLETIVYAISLRKNTSA